MKSAEKRSAILDVKVERNAVISDFSAPKIRETGGDEELPETPIKSEFGQAIALRINNLPESAPTEAYRCP